MANSTNAAAASRNESASPTFPLVQSGVLALRAMKSSTMRAKKRSGQLACAPSLESNSSTSTH